MTDLSQRIMDACLAVNPEPVLHRPEIDERDRLEQLYALEVYESATAGKIMKKQMYQKDVFALRNTRDPYLRWGQAIVNEYFDEPYPILYYEDSEWLVSFIMMNFFRENKIPYEEGV